MPTPPAESALAADGYEARQQRIVGGSSTTIAEWPWQAAITLNPASFPGDGFERQICGGSLVAPTIIVTAAHCVYNFGSDTWFPPSRFASITGRTTLTNSSQGQEITWSTYFFFVDGSGKKRYDPATNRWDVVFARLSSPSPSSTPIKIAGADEASFWAPGNENVWATGWGRTSFGGVKSNILREVNLDRLADSVCGTAYGAAHDSETMLCAGEITGDQSPCHGDSGGPLVTPIGGGAFRLVGDISWGFQCGAPNLPGNFGRVAQDPICSVLRNAIQGVAGVNVVGPGGCLPASSPAPPPPLVSNNFSFGKLKLKRRRGIAILPVTVPGAGRVILLRTPKVRRAVRNPAGAGVVRVPVRARGKALSRLLRSGGVRVRARVRFRPAGGTPRTKSRMVRLVKRTRR